MKCPKCHKEACHIISEVKTTGKDYSASKGCCGMVLMGPVGLLCGACDNCGHKWKA